MEMINKDALVVISIKKILQSKSFIFRSAVFISCVHMTLIIRRPFHKHVSAFMVMHLSEVLLLCFYFDVQS